MPTARATPASPANQLHALLPTAGIPAMMACLQPTRTLTGGCNRANAATTANGAVGPSRAGRGARGGADAGRPRRLRHDHTGPRGWDGAVRAVAARSGAVRWGGRARA